MPIGVVQRANEAKTSPATGAVVTNKRKYNNFISFDECDELQQEVALLNADSNSACSSASNAQRSPSPPLHPRSILKSLDRGRGMQKQRVAIAAARNAAERNTIPVIEIAPVCAEDDNEAAFSRVTDIVAATVNERTATADHTTADDNDGQRCGTVIRRQPPRSSLKQLMLTSHGNTAYHRSFDAANASSEHQHDLQRPAVRFSFSAENIYQGPQRNLATAHSPFPLDQAADNQHCPNVQDDSNVCWRSKLANQRGESGGNSHSIRSLQPPTNRPLAPQSSSGFGYVEISDFANIGADYMRVSGALQQFKGVLGTFRRASMNKISSLRQSGFLRSPRHSSTLQQPETTAGTALVNVNSDYPLYTQEKETTNFGADDTAQLSSFGALSPEAQKASTISYRLGRRKELFEKRRKACDYALIFALVGIIMMIVENELTATNTYSKTSAYSIVLKSMIVVSTILLLVLIATYHALEVQLFMIDNSAEDWRIAVTADRVAKFSLEMLVCAICPVPGSYYFKWTTVHSDGRTITTTDVPVDVLLSIPMFLRLHLICRVMLLHSRLFTDASSRSIGALNRINFNTKFVLKTLMTLCPGTVLLVFTASFWIISSFILRLCERHHTDNDTIVEAVMHQNYLNSLWMIAITFLSVGYGDIVPNTYCGRAVAVTAGIMVSRGAGTSSLVVAVIARKLELSRAEKHVHNFMMDTQLTKRLKHAAANVLRETWLIYKLRRLVSRTDTGKIRHHQRKFLMAIYELRKVKRDQRRLSENAMTVTDMAKQTSCIYELVSELHSWQHCIETRLANLEQLIQVQMQHLPDAVVQAIKAANQPDNPLMQISPVTDQNQNVP